MRVVRLVNASPLPPSGKRFFRRFFLGGLASAANARVEARAVLHDDVEVRLFLRQRGTRRELVIMSGGEFSVRAHDRTSEIVELGAGRVLPGLGASEVRDAKLTASQALGLVIADDDGAGFGVPSLRLGAPLRLVGRLSRAHGIAELDGRSIDVTIAVLAERLERVLRIPRHSREDQ